MKNILVKLLNKEIINKDIDNYLTKYLTQEERQELVELLQNIDQSKLFNSYVHGINHNSRVLLYAYILSKYEEEPLSKEDKQILFDACIYHDIGRSSDVEDSIHGFAASRIIFEVVDINKYPNPVDREILQAIINAHSVQDNKFPALILSEYSFSEKYDELEEEVVPIDIRRFYKLVRILKDADALDRKRLFRNSLGDLDSKYLRCSKSEELIPLAEDLNNFYYHLLSCVEPTFEKLDLENGSCLHSIGFDFFKLRPILQYGVLSKSEKEKLHIEVPSNFCGSNMNKWISVIPLSNIEKRGKAFQMFAKNGINFLCQFQNMYAPPDNISYDQALVENLPFTIKNKYMDERFVYEHIYPANIHALVLYDNNLHKNILDLPYIHATTSSKLLQDKIEYYMKNMGIEEIPDEFTSLLKNYHDMITKANADSIDRTWKQQEEIDQLILDIKFTLDHYLAEMIQKYYQEKIGKRELCVLDVIQCELESIYDLEVVDEEEQIILLKPKTILPKEVPKVLKKENLN